MLQLRGKKESCEVAKRLPTKADRGRVTRLVDAKNVAAGDPDTSQPAPSLLGYRFGEFDAFGPQVRQRLLIRLLDDGTYPNAGGHQPQAEKTVKSWRILPPVFGPALQERIKAPILMALIAVFRR